MTETPEKDKLEPGAGWLAKEKPVIDFHAKEFYNKSVWPE